MKSLLSKQRITRGSIGVYLRAFETSAGVAAETWTKEQVAHVLPGDLVFVLVKAAGVPGDSEDSFSSDEAESFSVRALILCHKWDQEPFCYLVTSDAYQKQNLQAYFLREASAAQSRGDGFYYVIVRPVAPSALAAKTLRNLAKLDSFGESGWRQDSVDIVYAFLNSSAFGLPVQPDQNPDFSEMGSVLFCRDALPTGNAPDLRPHVCLVHKDEPKVAWEPALPAPAPEPIQPTTQPATAKRKGLTLPKIGSLFGRSNKSDAISSQGNKVVKGARTDKPANTTDVVGAAHGAAQFESTEIVSDSTETVAAIPTEMASDSIETVAVIPTEMASDLTETVGAISIEIESDSTETLEAIPTETVAGPTDTAGTIATEIVGAAPCAASDGETHDFSPPAVSVENAAPSGEIDFSTSGVTGLVSRLEQQSTKAVTRLESCAEEIQQRLVAELARLKAETNQRQNDYAADLESLAGTLSRKIIDTTAEVENEIARTAGQHFDVLNNHQHDGNSSLTNRQVAMVAAVEEAFAKLKDKTNTIVDSIRQAMNQLSREELAKLESLFSDSCGELSGLYPKCEKTLDAAVNGFQDKRQPAHSSAKAAVDNRFAMFKRQLEEINSSGQTEIDQLKDNHVNQLEREFTLSESSVVAMRSSALQQEVLPRLKRHGEAIDSAAAELHQELSDELAQKAKDKLAEFEPLLVSCRKEIDRILSEVRATNDSMQDDARRKLQQSVERLDESVSCAIAECNTVAASTEAHLAGIDRAVRALADRSNIEGELALLTRRTEAWSEMEKATRSAQEQALNAMRNHISALDENGRHLQDDLVSTMEKGELELRRFAEQSFVSIKGVVHDAYLAIQNAQNERMQI